MRNYVSSTFEKWYVAIYVMKLEKSHLTGPIRVVPELTPLSITCHFFFICQSIFIRVYGLVEKYVLF